MADNLDYFYDQFYYEFYRKLNRGLDIYRKNLQLNLLNAKLQKLMQKDALTSVKNRTAYESMLAKLREDYVNGERDPFAVAMFDINNLKKINDSLGHESGDVYIKNSCQYICDCFAHSPVYRIGGDEFVAIICNEDYECRWKLVANFIEGISKLKDDEGISVEERISIAMGMAEYSEVLEGGIDAIFKKADVLMYENKRRMKDNEIR